MKIAQIRISNILGIKELEFTPEGFNEISGPNGQGKTSVLEAIKAAVKGGHDATLLRNGEDKGEVVLLLDDGTEINKRVTANSSPLTVTQDGVKLKRPTDFLGTLTDLLSVNPVDFLRAPKKDRVRVLLETMPIEADAAKLTKISGVEVTVQPGIHALALIGMVHSRVYDDRTGTNRAVKEKEATINQLRTAMPDQVEGVTGNEDEITTKVEEARTVKDTELDRVAKKLDGIRIENQAQIDEIRTKAQADIDAIKEAALKSVTELQTSLADIEKKAGQQKDLTVERFNTVVGPLNEALAAIKADRSAVAKREQLIETIDQMETELEGLVSDAKNQTKALGAIESYKSELLSSLPIPGLEVIDGEVFRDGVAFDRLNTAQQVDIAVEIAKLRSGELGIICVDGIELLDSAAFEEFKVRALASNLQLFVSRVSDEAFTVKTSTNA